MEYFGVFAFILVLYFSSCPGKIKKLEAKVKRLEKKQKGENVMSRLINDLVGKECKVKSEAAFELVGKEEMLCQVLDTDDEWMKVQYNDKKGNRVTKLLRIESVDEIEIL